MLPCQSNSEPHGTAPGRSTLWAGLVLSLVGGAGFAVWSIAHTDHVIREGLGGQAEIVAEAFSIEDLKSLLAASGRHDAPVYLRVKEQLACVKSALPGCQRVYLVARQADGQPYRLADSEQDLPPAASPDRRAQRCAGAGVWESLAEGNPRVEGLDLWAWGRPACGMAAIADPKTGRIVAVLGLEMDTRAQLRALALAVAVPLGSTLILVGVVAGSFALWKQGWRRPRLEAWTAASLGAILTASAAYISNASEAHRRLDAFDRLANDRTQAVSRAIHAVQHELEGLGRHLETSGGASKAAFDQYAEHLTLNPVVHAWEWIPVVPASARADFERSALGEGLNGFSIWEKRADEMRVPAGPREIYYPVRRVVPLAGNEKALGFDLGSESSRRSAIEEAARTGLLTGTEPVTLVQETATQKGILVVRPVNSEHGIPKGFALAVLRLGTTLRNASGFDLAAHQPAIMTALHQVRSQGRGPTLATSLEPGTGEEWADAVVRESLSACLPIFAFGKNFVVDAVPGPDFQLLHPRRAGMLTALAGGAITGALVFAIRLGRRRREELERLIAERTAALQDSEAYLSATLRSIGDGVISVDTAGRVVSLNTVAEQLTGWTNAEAVGTPIEDVFRIVEARSHAAVENVVTRVLREGVVIGLPSDTALVARDGTERQVADSCAPIRDQRGELAGVVLVFRDVSREKQSQELARATAARRQREAEVVAAVAASPALAEGALAELAWMLTEAASAAIGTARVGIWLFEDRGARLVNLDNYEAAPGTHSSGALLLEHEFESEFAVLKRDKYVDAHDALADPRTSGYVEGYLRPNGITSMLDAVIRSGGQNLGTLCFEHIGPARRWADDEITFACQLADQAALAIANRERRLAERALRESEERLQLSVSAAGLGLWDWDLVTGGMTFNARWAEILGYSHDRLERDVRNWEDLVHPDDRGPVQEALIAHFSGSSTHFQAEHRLRTGPGGWTWILNSGRVLERDERGRPIRAAGTCLDISERKQHEIRVERLSQLREITSKVLSSFISVEDLSGGIDLILREVGQFLDVSRSYLFRYRDRMEWLFNTHEWCAAGVQPQRDFLQHLPVADFEWWTRELLAMRPIRLGDLEREEIPSDLRAFLVAQGIKALLVLPVFIQGSLAGFIGFDETRCPRKWHDEEIALLQAMVEGFSRAVERRIAQRERNAVMGRMTLAAEAAGFGVWELDVGSNRLEWDDWMLRIFGIDRERFTGDFEAWKRCLHPEDRRQSLAEVQQALDGEKDLDTEFRILRANGEVRHIKANAVVVRDARGKPTRMTGINYDVTQRKRAEQALRESEANFRTFFETMTDMIVVGSPDGHILLTNAALSRTLGYDERELRAMNMLDLHPADRRQEAEAILAAMLRGERESCPLPLARKGGSLVPVETRVWFGRWNDMDCIFGIAKDLTAEQEAQQRFERLFRNNPALMAFTTLPDRRFTDINDAFVAALGYARAEIIGRTSTELDLFIHPEQQAMLSERLLRGQRIADLELQLRCKDGSVRDGLMSAEVISSQGRQYFLTVLIDITERRFAQKQLELQRQRLADIIEGTNVGTWEWDVQSGQTVFNERWAEIVGYRLEELSPVSIQTWRNLVHPDDMLESEERIRRHFSGETGYYDCECRMRHKDGSWVWVHDRGRVVQWTLEGLPARMTGTHSDITSRKLAEAELRQRTEQLQRANEALRASKEEVEAQQQELRSISTMAEEARKRALAASQAKTEFLARMSHEIRTPLTAVIGYADLLQRSNHLLPDACRTWIQNTRRSADHLASLINDVLDLSKIEAGQMILNREPSDPRAILAEFGSLMVPLAIEKGLGYHVACEGLLPESIDVDRLRLRQMLVNLVGNAIKFTEHGDVTVRVSVEQAAGGERSICFAVADTGVGIPAEAQQRIFDPFVQGPGAGGRSGTGLGLDITRRLARMHGGDLTLSSREGEGSTFSLRLPVGWETRLVPFEAASMPAVELRSSRAGASPRPLEDMRVLVVDDSADNQAIIGFLLQEAGARPDAAPDGAAGVEAVVAAGGRGTPYDVVLMDMLMPVMDGYAATRELRARGVRIPIIALTAHAMSDDRAKCLAAGCSGYVTKPIEPESFLETVRAACPMPATRAAGSDFPRRYTSTMAGNPQFAKLLRKYLHGVPQVIEQLEAAEARRDRDALRVLVHGLHGTAASYGFPEISEVAGRCEVQLRDTGDTCGLKDGLAELVGLLRIASADPHA